MTTFYSNAFLTWTTVTYHTSPHHTKKKISAIIFNIDDIKSIITSLNPNKSHEPDKIFVRMIQLAGDAIIYPLNSNFKSIIQTGVYPD